MNVSKLSDTYYYYTDPIGYGSFSIIYKGYNVMNSKIPLAIKRITKIIDMKYFNNEVGLMKRVHHENILKLYDVIKKDGTIYLILEYCNNGDLSKYISSNVHTNDMIYYNQIFKGLQYLSEHNILHRDMKPHNILIHNGIIKISDFGFAKSFEKNELITTFCGSPLYMAPEIIKNREYNDKSDIWSLGVIIYELFAKKHPYYTDSRLSLWNKIKDGITIDYSLIDNPDIVSILQSMLIENPTTRIQWVELFQQYSISDIDESDMIFTFDDYDRNISNSVIIPKKTVSSNMNIHSVNVQDDASFIEGDDYKIISKSAPNILQKSYLENYIQGRYATNQSIAAIPILGSCPETPPVTISSILNKSLKTVKNCFNM